MYRKSILVVDDEAAILRLSERAFRRQLDVTTAMNGTDALELLLSRDFDILLFDYAMGTMNGIELARLAASINPNAPRLLVTAHFDAPEVREALAEGIVAEIVPKPWVPSELTERIAHWTSTERTTYPPLTSSSSSAPRS